MTFARGNALDWGFNEKLTSAQMNATDAQWPDALDAAGGGSYTLTAPLTIGGAAFNFTDTVNFSGFVNLNGIATFNNDTQFNGGLVEIFTGSTLQGDAGSIGTWAGAWTFTGSTTLGGATIVDVSLTIDGGSVALLEVTSGGTAQVHSGATLQVDSGSTTNLAGPVALTGIVTASGSGRVVPRRIAGVNADHTYAIADGNIIDVPTLTATRNYTFSETGAQAGDTILITMASDATVTSVNGIVCLRGVDATQIGSSVVKTTAGNTAMEIIFNGSRWQPNHTSRY